MLCMWLLPTLVKLLCRLYCGKPAGSPYASHLACKHKSLMSSKEGLVVVKN